MISAVITLKRKLQLLPTKLQRQDPKDKDAAQLDSTFYIEHVQSIALEFERHFTDFASLEPGASYMCFPFGTDIDVDDIASKVGTLLLLDTTAVEKEILTLQNDVQMKSRASTDMKTEFWHLLSEK